MPPSSGCTYIRTSKGHKHIGMVVAGVVVKFNFALIDESIVLKYVRR
jgi:hypothetical protein